MSTEWSRNKNNRIWIMEVLKCGFALVAISSVCAVAQVTRVTPGKIAESCQPDKLTVYKVILHTFWTRDKFPKHYPDWRPPAQWSKLIGKSTVERLGQRFRLRRFVPGGRSAFPLFFYLPLHLFPLLFSPTLSDFCRRQRRADENWS